ncbi:glycosyltransferase family protein [Cohnella hongkongensis]|uniref:Glycosyltransferase n=1 Tax=Cohnella hongkongensis TaxID=178337 RepID=A0ABV9FCG1_9BACL
MSSRELHPFNGQIILFKGQSQYDVVRGFIDELKLGLEELGHRAVIIDFTEPSFVQQLQQALSQPVFFALGMNGIGIELKSGNQSLYDAGGFPFFAYLVDHPLYNMERLNASVHHLIVSCVDESHTQYLAKFHPKKYTRAFIPHGASANDEAVKPLSEREYSVIWTGTLADPEGYRRKWTQYDPHLSQLLDETVERALSASNRTLVEILSDLLREKGIGENPLFLRKLAPLLLPLDGYVRSTRRMQLLDALRDVQVHLFGNGWDRLPSSLRANKVIHPSVNYEQMKQLLGNSQISLNVLPYFTQGGHERVFMSMLSGSVVVTDSNSYLDRAFTPGEHFVSYSLSDWKAIPEMVSELQDNPARMEQIAEAGRAAVESAHLWKHRAAQIVETAKFHYTFYPFE